MRILFIIESSGKIAKLSKILGKNYTVKASMGHVRDLDNKKMSIDFQNNFKPVYIITKPLEVKKLKAALRDCDMVYLAADLDYEGEAIAQSLYEILKPKQYKRLRFNSITQDAITTAIKNASTIDQNLVDAQKTRRVIDRIFGYLVSPILQRQIGGSLSAGRVQSPTLRLVVEKENEIKIFLEKNKDATFFKVHGLFSGMKATLYGATNEEPHLMTETYSGRIAQIPLSNGENPDVEVVLFLNRCLKSEFVVHSVSDKISMRTAAAPFTTSSLQQEANRKFGMPIDATMKTAQKLYEAGYITYMRTDSVDISAEGKADIKKVIEKEYGKEYYQKNIYKSKASNAQNAHECIRPTHPEMFSIEKEVGDSSQIKLYRLVWQRTIASQMKPAKINITTIQTSISKLLVNVIMPYYYFQSQIEKVIFPGFMAVYVESVDDEEDSDSTKNFSGKIPKVNDKLVMEEIVAKQEYLKPPPRYSQASLVKKLEAIGIGRPSTYVNTIKTIMDRDYIKIADIPGTKKDIMVYTIRSENSKPIKNIFEHKTKVLLGKENKKIIPTSLGTNVNDFLMQHFAEMVDYKFTAKMEEEMDLIAGGKKIWYKVVQKFYDKLKPVVDKMVSQKNIGTNDKLLGADSDGTEIYATRTKYGPVVKKQLGPKTVYAKINGPLKLETITLDDAIKLLAYPKLLGQFNKANVYLQRGPYGFYLNCDGTNYNVPTNIPENKISIEEATAIISERKTNLVGEFIINRANRQIKAMVLKGKFGPYVQTSNGSRKDNYPIPRNLDANKLTEKQILEIITNKKPKKNNTGSKKNSQPKKNPKKKYQNKN